MQPCSALQRVGLSDFFRDQGTDCAAMRPCSCFSGFKVQIVQICNNSCSSEWWVKIVWVCHFFCFSGFGVQIVQLCEHVLFFRVANIDCAGLPLFLFQIMSRRPCSCQVGFGDGLSRRYHDYIRRSAQDVMLPGTVMAALGGPFNPGVSRGQGA